jgi:hypothetical protein
MAIQRGNAEFVQALLANGLLLAKFLTYRCLIKLYNTVQI